jgi:hypothetical protein
MKCDPPLLMTILGTRQLLHNPSGPHALPSGVEQWCHDIDQLIIAAINTSPHGSGQVNLLSGVPVLSVAHSRSPVVHSHSPVALRVSLIVHAASLATTRIIVITGDFMNLACKIQMLRLVPMHGSRRSKTTGKTTSFLMNMYPLSRSFVWLRDTHW